MVDHAVLSDDRLNSTANPIENNERTEEQSLLKSGDDNQEGKEIK
jgi:hypothetical protein